MESSSVEKETTRLWRVYKTVHQLLHDRGYVVSQSQLDRTLSEFIRTYGTDGSVVDRAALTVLVQKRDNPSDQMFVFFPEDTSVGVKPIRGYIERMNEQGVFKAILVVRQSMTSSAAKIMGTMAPKYILEHFTEAELVINITEHVLVPQHILMSEEEKKMLLSRYRLKETQLPRILISDPVARYYGLRRGQVVKIIRASETAGRYVTYRLAV